MGKNDSKFSSKALDLTRDLLPSEFLQSFGHIIDMKTGTRIKFDPYRITKNLQATMLAYIDAPPRLDTGETTFLAALGSRQVGKSNTPAAGFLVPTMRTPELSTVTIADKDSRAQGLLDRAHSMLRSFPAEIRTPMVHERAQKHIQFDPLIGGTYSILSAQKDDVGIGKSFDQVHFSEVAFWPNAAGVITGLLPAIYNRFNSKLIAECTPSPPSAPSTEYWRDLCALAKRGEGRWIYTFAPHWDSTLNARELPNDFVPTVEEIRRLDKYEHLGMTLENLNFRRHLMASNPELRRFPALFDVWYPSDDVSCWIQAGFSAIPAHALQKHIDSSLHSDMPKGAFYHEFEPPTAQGAGRYIIGADPAGAGTDHSAFVVLEVWSDETRQVASFSNPFIDTISFAKELIRVGERYGGATIAVERNGVGQGVLDYLLAQNYPAIYCEKPLKPGIWASAASNARFLTNLIDNLLANLVILDSELISQASRYQNEKLIQLTDRQIVVGVKNKRARDRSHFDRLSALMTGLWAARTMNHVAKPRIQSIEKPKLTLTFAQWEEYRKDLATDKAQQEASKPNAMRVKPYVFGKLKKF